MRRLGHLRGHASHERYTYSLQCWRARNNSLHASRGTGLELEPLAWEVRALPLRYCSPVLVKIGFENRNSCSATLAPGLRFLKEDGTASFIRSLFFQILRVATCAPRLGKKWYIIIPNISEIGCNHGQPFVLKVLSKFSKKYFPVHRWVPWAVTWF